MIPYGRQEITPKDIADVVDVLKSDFITQGPAISAFENRIAVECQAAHAIAVTSATAALHLGCLALGLGPGDILWTSPITFVASANAGLMCGARVDFVDIDPDTLCMSPEALRIKLEQAEIEGNLPKIVMPVHFAGQSADMRQIEALSKQYGFRIIEDASHAIGGRYHDKPIGSCRYSDLCVFSFHPVKIVTTGEGGAIVTNQADLATKIEMLRSHGITRDPNMMEGESEGGWYYQQIMLGFNYRITDIQAALGLSQLDRLHDYVTQRHILAERYRTALADMPLRLTYLPKESYSALHLFPIQLKEQVSMSRREVYDRLRAAGIGVNVHYIPVHLQPYYKKLGFRSGDFPAAEAYYKRAISIPLFPTLTRADQDQVISALQRILNGEA